MKKFNINIVVFIFAIIFIIWGAQGDLLLGVLHEVRSFGEELISGNYRWFIDFKSDVDNISSENLSYHEQLMDINSIKENLLGNRIVEKDDAIYAKSESGSLIKVTQKRITDEELDRVASSINELKMISEENGANFLYCAAPSKSKYEISPNNISNYEKDNYQRFLKHLSKKQVPYMDFSNSLRDNSISDNDIFFYTDHHWKPYCGFIAANSVCRELNLRYGFEYDETLTKIENYNIDIYKDWFLGSYGKRLGTYFTWVGAEDFELITPKFKSSLVEEQPIKNIIRTGHFEDTVLYTENLKKDFYSVNTYATYSGGDFRLQIIKNNLNSKGKKVLVVRDSFACVVTPFLSLQTKELHVCDMRDMADMVGKKLNMKEYIRKINPDYVIVLYTSVGDDSDSRYDFF